MSNHQRAIELIATLIAPPKGCDVIFCRDKDEFSLDVMTEADEKKFRTALQDTKVSVVSFPLGSKKRFEDLFGDGKCISSYLNAGRTIYIPVGVFKKRWYKDNEVSSNVLVL